MVNRLVNYNSIITHSEIEKENKLQTSHVTRQVGGTERRTVMLSADARTPSTLTPMSPPLFTLPDELIVELFSYLHPRDIAACQRSCRQLNDTIIHSQLLQYLICVGRSGLYDPLLPSHTVSQRIDALEKWESAWSEVETKSSSQVKFKIACPFKCRFDSTSRIRDDFLIVTKSSLFDSPGYGYVDLRAFQSEGKRCSWTTIANHSWSDKHCLFAFSVEQDLVLVAL